MVDIHETIENPSSNSSAIIEPVTTASTSPQDASSTTTSNSLSSFTATPTGSLDQTSPMDLPTDAPTDVPTTALTNISTNTDWVPSSASTVSSHTGSPAESPSPSSDATFTPTGSPSESPTPTPSTTRPNHYIPSADATPTTSIHQGISSINELPSSLPFAITLTSTKFSQIPLSPLDSSASRSTAIALANANVVVDSAIVTITTETIVSFTTTNTRPNGSLVTLTSSSTSMFTIISTYYTNYTPGTTPPTSAPVVATNSNNKVGVIVGVVSGVVALVAISFGIFCMYRRRRRQSREVSYRSTARSEDFHDYDEERRAEVVPVMAMSTNMQSPSALSFDDPQGYKRPGSLQVEDYTAVSQPLRLLDAIPPPFFPVAYQPTGNDPLCIDADITSVNSISTTSDEFTRNSIDGLYWARLSDDGIFDIAYPESETLHSMMLRRTPVSSRTLNIERGSSSSGTVIGPELLQDYNSERSSVTSASACLYPVLEPTTTTKPPELGDKKLSVRSELSYATLSSLELRKRYHFEGSSIS